MTKFKLTNFSSFLIPILAFSFIFAESNAFGITLDEAQSLSNLQNAQLLAAKQKVNSAKGQELNAWQTALPNLTLQASATRIDSYQNRVMEQAFGGDSSLFPNRSYSAKVNFTQPIFNPAILPAFGAASAYSDSMSLQLESIRQSVLLDTVSSYYAVARASEMERLASENIGVLSVLLRQVKEMSRLGAVTQSDAMAVEVRLKDAERSQNDAKKATVLSKMKLNSVIGQPLDSEVTVNVSMNSQISLPEAVDPVVAVAEALKNRPSLKSLRRTKDLLESNVTLAKTGYLPGLYLVGNYGYTGFTGDFLKSSNKDWSVTVSGTWNIFDGFSTTSKLQVAEAGLKEHQENIKLAEQGVQLEVIDAVLSIDTAKKGLQLAETAVNLSQRTFTEVNERYKAGGATNTDLLTAQLTLSQARVGMLNAQYDAVLAGYRYQCALGKIPTPKLP